MARFKDFNWNLRQTPAGQAQTDEDVTQAILMDIRDELKELNKSLFPLRCSNFIAIPRILRRISANTAKPRKKARGPKIRKPR